MIRTWISGRERPKFDYHRVPGVLLTNRSLLQAMRANRNGNKSKFGADSAALVEGGLAHETYGRNGAKGHQGQMELAAKSLDTCGKVPAILERVVAEDTGTADFRVRIVLTEGMRSLFAAASHEHVFGNHSDAPYYEVVSQVTTVDHTYPSKQAAGDAQEAADPLTAPGADWKCSRVY